MAEPGTGADADSPSNTMPTRRDVRAGASGSASPDSASGGSRPSSTPAPGTSADPRLRPRGVRARERSEAWVRFSIHPWQRSAEDAVAVREPGPRRSARCAAPPATSEERYVVLLDRQHGRPPVTAEVTLSRRDEMGFRMLVGREALRQGFLVDPGRSYLGGRARTRSVRRRNRGHEPDGARVVRRSARSGSAPGTARAPRAADHPAGHGRRRQPAGAGVHGREDGPDVWVDAAIHGDEVVGVEVIRQVLAGLDPKTFRGTLSRCRSSTCSAS